MADALWAREFSEVRFSRAHRLGVDAYSVQHPERYCKSAKSMVAHLGGLCCAFERRGDPEALRRLQRWLIRGPSLVRPEPPRARGAITIAELTGIDDPALYAPAVERWARSAWEAYAALQPIARAWVEQAMARR